MLVTLAIPADAKCLLKSGQSVNFGTPYLERKVVSAVTVPAAKILNINPSKIFNHLRKFVGDNIEKGDLLAVNKGVLSTKKLQSDYTGTIKEIDHHHGNIIITTDSDAEKKQGAFFRGEVVQVKKEEIIIDLKKGKEFPLSKATGDFGGETSYSADNLASKILLTEAITPYLQMKVEAIGVNGFVLLTSLKEQTDLPYAQVKTVDDFKKIKQLHFPYCLINKERSTIYFYE